jgi:hypothetical protein
MTTKTKDLNKYLAYVCKLAVMFDTYFKTKTGGGGGDSEMKTAFRIAKKKTNPDRNKTKGEKMAKGRVARWFVFKPKISIWANFGVP